MSSITDSYCSTTALFDDQSCVEDSCAEEERRQDVAVLTAEDGLTGNRVEEGQYSNNANKHVLLAMNGLILRSHNHYNHPRSSLLIVP